MRLTPARNVRHPDHKNTKMFLYRFAQNEVTAVGCTALEDAMFIKVWKVISR